MGQIKKLAGQTLWYGGSSVVAKLLNALLTPVLTYLMVDKSGMEAFGKVSLIYAYFGVLNVVFTYGMETGYFRFSNKPGVDRRKLFQTTFGSLLVSTILFCGLLYIFRFDILDFTRIGNNVQYIFLCILILAFDTLAAIPFAKLRQDARPKRYAFIKIIGIIINIVCIIFFLAILPGLNNSFVQDLLSGFDKVSLILLANVLGSAVVFFLLFNEWRSFRFSIDKDLLKQVFAYSSPMLVIGLAGMINEVMDRAFLNKWYSGTPAERITIVGIYSACYKISIVITMFIQAFKMAAEPFFFNRSADKNAPALYARVMNWFVITLCVAFLFTALFLDYWKYYVQENYRVGLYIVPVLLFANIFSGIYYNLSIWYKLTDRMRYGIYITVIGALVTLVGNYFFIPRFGMMASAWTTLACYSLMVVLCYLWGQKFFKVPYNISKILSYLAVMLLVFFIQEIIKSLTPGLVIRTLSGFILLSVFVLYIIRKEKEQIYAMPVVGKWLRNFD